MSETESTEIIRTIDDIEREWAEAHPPAPAPAPYPPDVSATWAYWTDTDTADRGIPTEWVWERLRMHRDQLLDECDFRVVADAPWDAAPWIAYRQALRDLPDTTSDPGQAVWPTAPDAT